jgi:signal transduction histidine kinase/DNA-binding response OmpR family regulator
MKTKADYKILIYDNLDSSSTLVYDNISKYGYLCMNIANLEELEQELKKNESDLVIFNTDNTNQDALIVLQRISAVSDVKIVFITSCTDQFVKDTFLFLNIVDYKIKFNNLLAILSDVNNLIERLIANTHEKVLLIQKDALEREYLENLLTLRGYDLTIASSGNQGWKEIDKIDDLSLLLVDINITGIECIDIINKAKKKYSDDMPIVSFASEYDPLTLQQLISSGLSYFFKLPISVEEFNLKTDLLVDNIRQKREVAKKQVQLEENLQGFKALANATIEALVMFEDNICVDANEEAIKMFEFESKESFLGTHMLGIVPDSISTFDRDELLKDDTDHEFEIEMKKKNDTIFPAHIKERNLVLDNRNLKILAVLDLTEIKRKENMLNHQSKMAALGEMMGNIAHQWRQPLTAISIAASGIKLNYEIDMVEEEELFEQLDGIIDSTDFLSNTINDFQNFLKTNKAKEFFALSNSVKKVLKLVEGNLKKEKINIIEQYEDEFEVYGVPNEMVQSLLNIVNNAKDAYMQKNDTKVILIEIKKLENSSDKIVLRIHDGAGGIPENVLPKIFEPYFTTKHQSQGTGLGLYMTHQMVQDHMQGELKVENKEFTIDGKSYFGAEFKIILPFKNN